MLLDVPAVANTEGTAHSITWRYDGIYRYPGVVYIPGVMATGENFDDNDAVTQDGSGATGVTFGGQDDTTTSLLIDAVVGTPTADGIWNGAEAPDLFTPTDIPRIYRPESVFIYIDTPEGAAYIVRPGRYSIENGIDIKLERNPPQGSTIKFLACVAATFTVPAFANSWTLRNISGADMHFRRYAPNVEANVIDVTAKSFGESSIVGQILGDNDIIAFHHGSFTPGSSYMLCATAAATGGAIVDFYP